MGPVMEQPQYHMFEREKIEKDYLHIYQYEGLGTTIWSPLASGLLSGKYNNGMPTDTRLNIEGMDWLKERMFVEGRIEKIKKLAALATELGISLPVMAIAWVLKNEHVSTAILGASKLQQLEENLKALDAVSLLTDEIIEKIESILENKPVQPQF
jgi:aryl-alcohol dehydrogenase-like predicted oxidoreductase